MKFAQFSIRTLGLAAALLTVAAAALADPPPRHERDRDPHYASPHWQLDARYHHDHYYPARGYVVPSLPVGHIVINHPSGPYYFHAGVWFRPHGPRWVVVAPPIGIVIPVLPLGFATVYWRGLPYYYADDVYYVRADSGYRVVEAPPANEITVTESPLAATAPPVAVAQSVPVTTVAKTDGLFVYPKNGQTESQTAFDRIECVKWAVGQTGFDPSQPTGDADARANFQRAASACLEARGYSVK